MPEPLDPVADYLRTVQTSDAVRAQAWDAVHAATDDADLQRRLTRVAVPNDVRAQLFDLSPSAKTAAPQGGRAGTAFGSQLTPEWDARVADGEWKDTPVAPFLTGGMVTTGMNAVQKAYETGKVALKTVAPTLKYEGVKTGLEAVGVPSAIAVPIAMAVSAAPGRRAPSRPRQPRQPRAATATPAAPAAAPAAPTLAPQASPAVPSAPVSAPSPTTGPQWSPQRIRNEVGLAARRSGTPLTSEQASAADALVRQGHAPLDAVRAVAQPAAPASAALAAPAAAPKVVLNAAESKEYVRLRRAGQSHPKAVEAIEQQRALVQRLGLPSSETVRATSAFPKGWGK